MDVLEMTMPFERHICAKADSMRIPIGATIELLPVCNMDCKMCYVRMSAEEQKKEGRLRTVDEWLSIIRQAQEKGLLFVLLTGGEPLLYPGFRELYRELKALGMVICINTNGTLIDESMADFLAQDPPRRVNISIYGSSDERYGSLCNNPKGFSQMMAGVKLLKERNIAVKWNYSVTKYNVDDMEEIYQLAAVHEIPVETAYYMFPPARKQENVRAEDHTWLSPRETAIVRIKAEIHDLGINEFREKCKVMHALKKGDIRIEKPDLKRSFTCRAGTSTFWFNWKGELLSCGMIGEHEINVFEEGFEEGWVKLQKWTGSYSHPEKCTQCPYETICVRCAAASYAEEQDFEQSPSYVCELMDYYMEFMEKLDESDDFEKTLKEICQ
ncbi:MAG: radical SAM protein [Lachnospiraceae bacterium]